MDSRKREFAVWEFRNFIRSLSAFHARNVGPNDLDALQPAFVTVRRNDAVSTFVRLNPEHHDYPTAMTR
ncbi:hypothetical protein Enr13x_07170 [Stieleria neptunia]|uniref:Uncharacterized protein n=1 Tax=Stieleria neptunia TaxID=2527979 RepID=A0A518HJ50_9BACT|nr:hypothetical protein Enr13x_07170 [Stieleria neptunia]